MTRMNAVVFDALGTLFSLEKLKDPLEQAGLPGSDVELWIARTLRDGFTLAATDYFAPFAEVARATLTQLFDERGQRADTPELERVLEAFARLEAYDDVSEGLTAVRERGLRTAVLTNGGLASTLTLLDGNGLGDLFDVVLSIDEVGTWKPSLEPYLAVADMLGVEPGTIALVAAHEWDVHGAKRAGLQAGLVRRGRAPASHVFEPADVEGASIAEVCERLLSRAGEAAREAPAVPS